MGEWEVFYVAFNFGNEASKAIKGVGEAHASFQVFDMIENVLLATCTGTSLES